MSSSPKREHVIHQDLWNGENVSSTFHSLTVKPKSAFQRRQVFMFITVLCVITLSVCYFTAWVIPTPVTTRPWQLKTGKPCDRSILGKDLVTDEHGYTCPWQDSWMQPSGCCDHTAASATRFSCETCDPSVGCCGVYELCVSCCLKEDNLQTHFQSDRMKQLASKDKDVFKTLQDPFELCQLVCRTSSHSLNNVDGSAVFRSESLKYCYNSPSKETSSITNNGEGAAVNVGTDFLRHTTSFLTGSAPSTLPFIFGYYLLIMVASLAFFYC